MIKLNIGCASRPLNDYINIDMDSIDDIQNRYPNVNIPIKRDQEIYSFHNS